VELVYKLPEAAVVPHAPVTPGDPDDDPFCSFWSGDDPRIHAELCELLDKESIRHMTVRRADHLFHFSKYPAFQMGIPFSMFERAEAVVKEAYGAEAEPEDVALMPYEKQRTGSSKTIAPWLPAPRGFSWSGSEKGGETPQSGTAAKEGLVGKASENARADWDPEDWFPEDATVEIWEGDQPEMGELLAASLSENQIHSRIAAKEGIQRLFVLPEDEARAREIVREVIEGVPPE